MPFRKSANYFSPFKLKAIMISIPIGVILLLSKMNKAVLKFNEINFGHLLFANT